MLSDDNFLIQNQFYLHTTHNDSTLVIVLFLLFSTYLLTLIIIIFLNLIYF